MIKSTLKLSCRISVLQICHIKGNYNLIYYPICSPSGAAMFSSHEKISISGQDLSKFMVWRIASLFNDESLIKFHSIRTNVVHSWNNNIVHCWFRNKNLGWVKMTYQNITHLVTLFGPSWVNNTCHCSSASITHCFRVLIRIRDELDFFRIV